LVVDITWKNIDKLIGRDGFCELLRKTADFTADLILFLYGRTSKNCAEPLYRNRQRGKTYKSETKPCVSLLLPKPLVVLIHCMPDGSSSNHNETARS
jgi:hypothetical protein